MKLTTILVIAVLAIGCAAKAKDIRGTDEAQRAAGIVPCDTDSDCAAKNPQIPEDSDGVTKAGVAWYYCEAITTKGVRCKRHVHEAGLLCPQHAALLKAGKTVRTIQ